VQGLWHQGTVTTAALASLGHRVVGLDFDEQRVDALTRGRSPVAEPGLEELIESGLASGNLRYTASPEEATRDIDVHWVTYDTPVDENDDADVNFVVAQVQRVLRHLPAGTPVLVSSQLPVGSIRSLEAFVAASYPGKALSFACSPENLRLGEALDSFLHRDRIVVGVRSGQDVGALERLVRSISDRIEWMSVESAEMTKHALNAFLATSVTFANEIASICEAVGADAKEVERGLKTERRIGRSAYLAPGAAFGGGSLARDIRFLNRISEAKERSTPVLASVKPSNQAHKAWARRKLQELFPDLSRTVIAIWGLTYKPGTDTLRRSNAVELCDWLLQQRVTLRVHDPAVRELPGRWSGKVHHCEDPLAAVEQAQALVVATAWPLYVQIPADRLLERARPLTVLDAGRFLSGYAGKPGMRYVAVGTPDPFGTPIPAASGDRPVLPSNVQ
jgi:UDPglucose 6-dehydrogenase